MPEKFQSHAEQEAELVSDMIYSPLNRPRVLRARHGLVAGGTDAGFYYKDENEDSLLVDTRESAYVAIDGIGGYGGGGLAAKLLGREMLNACNGKILADMPAFLKDLSGKDASWKNRCAEAQSRAHASIKFSGGYGACYLGIRLFNGLIECCHAGDVRLLYMRKDGSFWKETKDQGKGNTVTNAVTATGPGRTAHLNFQQKVGWRFVLATDGLWKVLSSQEVVGMIARKDVPEAMNILEQVTRERMQSKRQGDNRTILIGDIDRIV